MAARGISQRPQDALHHREMRATGEHHLQRGFRSADDLFGTDSAGRGEDERRDEGHGRDIEQRGTH